MSGSVCSYDRLSCVDGEIKPLEHQRLVTKFLLQKNTKGVLVFHSLGSGKTLTSLISIKALLSKFPNKKVIVITPASLVSNYSQEMKKVKIDESESVKIQSYMTFINSFKPEFCKNTIFVVDEAHHFGRSGVTTNIIKRCAKNAFKVILLSATPIQNSIEEIVPLLYMITPKEVTEKQIKSSVREAIISGRFDLVKELKCKVSFYNKQDFQNFPTSSEHRVYLDMSSDYYSEYYKIQENYRDDLPEIFQNTKNLLVFFNGIRRSVNKLKVNSPKIEWVMKKILEGKKTLVYTNWKSAGIDILVEELKKNNIKHGVISGSINRKTKDYYVESYNSGKINVILITASGAEGLNLKNTRNIIILDSHWNKSRINQVIGRGIRYKSHSELPKSERHVDVWYPILKKPKKLLPGDKMPLSADLILHQISEIKEKVIMDFYNKLSKMSIENDPSCIE
ncbi:MAG TPA: helicase-related protein [Allocoleopsis sp.]